MAVYKNIASQKVAVYAYDTSADAPKTGDAANITARISKDGAAVAQSNDVNPTEIDATHVEGVYLFDLTQAESNCDLFVLSAESATGNILIEPVIIYTMPGDSTSLAADMIEISGDSTAADNSESFFDGTGYAGTNNVIPTVTTVAAVTIVNALAASALADMFNTDSGTTYAASVAGSVVQETADNAGGSALTVDAIWDETMDTNAAADAGTARELMRIFAAVLAGKTDEGTGAQFVARDTGDTKNVVTATLDNEGYRTAVTLDGTQ